MTAEIRPLHESRSLDDWADQIRIGLTQAVEGLVRAGLALMAARAEHPGTFLGWLESDAVPVSRSAAYRLMDVAQAFADFPALGSLPADRTALYELSRLSVPQLMVAIEAGHITPSIGRQEARAIVARYSIETDVKGVEREVAPPPGGKYRTLILDVPWKMDNQITRGAASHHYPLMSLQELAELELPAAEDGAHIYMWAPNAMLHDAYHLVEGYGFQAKTLLTWFKEGPPGLGNHFRSLTEHVIYGTTGPALPRRSRSLTTAFRAPRGRHSEKPDVFYDLVMEASHPPYVELFARRKRPGIEVWGNEV